jgi:LysR family hydrogen peroxide-inducible transcriptional activator
MNLSHLKFASTVASAGSFTSAARLCHVTQPTLSNGVAQLEAELGERLFLRTTRTVALTAFGKHIVPYIDEVLRAQAGLLQQSRAFHSPQQRLIRIGTSPLLNAKLLAPMIEPFTLHHSSVDVVLREMNMADLFRMLQAGLLDFVFGVVDAAPEKWRTAYLYEEPLRFIPRGAVWRQGKRPSTVRLADIANETFVMVPDACGLSRETRRLFRRHRRKLLEYSGEAMSYQVLEEWAALGVGAAILPLSKIATNAHESLSITDSKTGREVTIAFQAMWPRTDSQAQHLQDFAHHLHLVAPKLIAGASSK